LGTSTKEETRGNLQLRIVRFDSDGKQNQVSQIPGGIDGIDQFNISTFTPFETRMVKGELLGFNVYAGRGGDNTSPDGIWAIIEMPKPTLKS
jgi:hypothetical protein